MSPARNGSKWIQPKRRHAIYGRDDYTCLYCGLRKVFFLTLDHYQGHSNCSSNLLTCCQSCNSAKRNLSSRRWYELLRKRLGVDVKATRKIQSRIRVQLKKPVGRLRKTA